jgi:hypothetical protein
VSAASAALLWWLARHELQIGPVCAALFVIVPLLTDRAMFYFTGAASEPWMLFGWVTALLLVRRLTRIAADGWSAPVTAVALGLTLAATALARTQGIAVGAAVLVALGASRVGARVVLIAVVAAVVPLATWNIWHGAMMAHGPLSPLPDQRSYLAWIPTNSVTSFSRFAVAMVRTSVPLYWSNSADILVGWASAKTLLLAAALGIAGAFALDRTLIRTSTVVRRGAIAGVALVTIALAAMNARLRVESARGAPHSPYARAMAEIVGWVEQNTPANDHIMTSWGGVIYLRSTSISNPEEPMLGAGIFAAPHQFYATRLLADSVDHVIIWDGAPGRAAAWLRALGSRCPGVLTEVARTPTTASAPSAVHYYSVRRDLPCLVELVGSEVKSGI